MRIYRAVDEENIRAARFIQDWAAEGLITPSQKETLSSETETSLRRTNEFLRAVLFVFTAGVVAALTALYFELFKVSTSSGVQYLVIGGLCYALAETLIRNARLYRHGIEEALAVLAVLFLCFGVHALIQQAYFLQANVYQGSYPSRYAWVSLVGAAASFLIYRRIGYFYAAFAVVVFAGFIPYLVTSSDTVRRLLLMALCVVGLLLSSWRKECHRADFRYEDYSGLEALFWLAFYLTCNLQLTDWTRLGFWFGSGTMPTNSGWFYWATYAAVIVLPLVALARALREKDKPLLGIAIVLVLLTLITNKPYLGWTRHPWDPMLLGVFLIGVVLAVRHWLNGGVAGVRQGFTARRLSAKDTRFLNAMHSAAAVVSPQSSPNPSPTQKPDFGGGQSGGGGASSSY